MYLRPYAGVVYAPLCARTHNNPVAGGGKLTYLALCKINKHMIGLLI